MMQPFVFLKDVRGSFPSEAQRANISPLTVSCSILAWKPLTEESKDDYNRMHCEMDYFWYDTKDGKPEKVNPVQKFGRTDFVWSFGEDTVAPLGMEFDPSFKVTGESAKLLAEVLKKSYENTQTRKELKIKKVRDQKGSVFYYLVSEDVNNPVLLCSPELSQCSFQWMKLAVAPTQISMGENADVLVKALCWSAKPDSGECPNILKQNTDFNCTYIGASVPFDLWGAIDQNSALRCDYKANNEAAFLQYHLGIVQVSGTGGNFSSTDGVKVKGPGLRKIFESLKSYSLDHPEETAHYSKGPLHYSELAYSPAWGSEDVSLRLARTVQKSGDEVAGLICGKGDVSTEAMYREPSNRADILVMSVIIVPLKGSGSD